MSIPFRSIGLLDWEACTECPWWHRATGEHCSKPVEEFKAALILDYEQPDIECGLFEPRPEKVEDPHD